MKIATRKTTLMKKKMLHARKVTEQRMATMLPSPSPDEEEALVSLYSTLVDEDEFELEEKVDGTAPCDDFLTEVEEQLRMTGSEEGQTRLSEVKNKILERVRGRKMERKKRRESICSLSSYGSQKGMKRMNSENAGGDHSRTRSDPLFNP